SVHKLMSDIGGDLVTRVAAKNAGMVGCGLSDIRVEQVYWDFESFLSEVCIALDLLARVVGPAFRGQAPADLNKFCKLSGDRPIVAAFRKAQSGWVRQVKDYRDCFTHYTPVDTFLGVHLDRYRTGWQLRAKIPINPNAREILRFRFSQRREL